MAYGVSVDTPPSQRTAVVVAATTWAEFPALWPALLAEVWAVVRAHDGITPGRNVMLYKDDAANVEIGVEVVEEFEAIGRVVCGRLPEGRVARTTHRGRYDDLGRGHTAVVEWCDRRGLERAGPRWEIYGHHTDVVAEQTVEIAYLLR